MNGLDDDFWISDQLRLAVARALHRENFTSDASADRHWECRPRERSQWFMRAPRVIDAMRREALAQRPNVARQPTMIEPMVHQRGKGA